MDSIRAWHPGLLLMSEVPGFILGYPGLCHPHCCRCHGMAQPNALCQSPLPMLGIRVPCQAATHHSRASRAILAAPWCCWVLPGAAPGLVITDSHGMPRTTPGQSSPAPASLQAPVLPVAKPGVKGPRCHSRRAWMLGCGCQRDGGSRHSLKGLTPLCHAPVGCGGLGPGSSPQGLCRWWLHPITLIPGCRERVEPPGHPLPRVPVLGHWGSGARKVGGTQEQDSAGRGR